MFKKGDTVVYPVYGVGIIEGIEKKAIADHVYTFFMLRIVETDYTIMIPMENAEKVGLRLPADKKTAAKVWKILRDVSSPPDTQTWNRRQRDYNDKIKTGDLQQLAIVLRDLYLLAQKKELSYGERKMMETARNLLVGELAAAVREKPEKIIAKIEAIFQEPK
jgi:CarD family transcriptional regulator